jgi:hypothetical protein
MINTAAVATVTEISVPPDTVSTMTNVEVITTATYIFFVYLVLAIFVERLMEVLVAVFNYAEFKFHWYTFWNRKAKKYQVRLDQLYSYQGEGINATKKLFDWFLWKIISEKPYDGGKRIIHADLIRLNTFRVCTRIIAFLISLIFVISFELDFLAIIENAFSKIKFLIPITQSGFVRTIITALAISLGVEPLHQLISHVEKTVQEKTISTQEGGTLK